MTRRRCIPLDRRNGREAGAVALADDRALSCLLRGSLHALSLALFFGVATAASASAQQLSADSAPIAIVPLPANQSDGGAKVSGALEVTSGRAIIASSGSVTAGKHTAEIQLPHRGTLRICTATTVKISADRSVPAGGGATAVPGLLLAMDHGAIEASFASGRNADQVMTPDFRILIGGPGAVDVKIRLGEHGDTCVDNPGLRAPYVLVTSVFGDGAYHVQPGQRVMFQHGSLHEVVDNEKESCGCPPAEAKGNEFPLAQSAGLAPLAEPSKAPVVIAGAPTETLSYNGATQTTNGTSDQKQQKTEAEVLKAAPPAPIKKKESFFSGVKRFFQHVFGDDQGEAQH